MIELILLLLLLAALGLAAAWMAEHPGMVTMYWLDYRIDTSFGFLILLFILGGILLSWCYLLTRRMVLAPQLITQARGMNKYRKGIQELTHSVVALAASDIKSAELHTQKAEKYLGRTPITLLLSAQVSRLQGDDIRTQSLLESMLEHKETEYLAARYLSDTASKQHKLPKARELARRAHALNSQGTQALLSLHIRLSEWQEAAILLTRSVRRGQLSRQELKHYQAVLHTQHAHELLEENQIESATVTAKHAISAAHDFEPAQVVYIQSLLMAEKFAKAAKYILSRWKVAPSLQLGELFRLALTPMPKEIKLRNLKKLTTIKPDAYETQIAVAEVAIGCGEWKLAREALKNALAGGDTAQACKLMAEVEQAEFADFDAAARWLSRSTNAPSSPAWLCSACGHASKHWAAHCTRCHSFDTLEWKQREMTFQQ